MHRDQIRELLTEQGCSPDEADLKSIETALSLLHALPDSDCYGHYTAFPDSDGYSHYTASHTNPHTNSMRSGSQLRKHNAYRNPRCAGRQSLPLQHRG